MVKKGADRTKKTDAYFDSQITELRYSAISNSAKSNYRKISIQLENLQNQTKAILNTNNIAPLMSSSYYVFAEKLFRTCRKYGSNLARTSAFLIYDDFINIGCDSNILKQIWNLFPSCLGASPSVVVPLPSEFDLYPSLDLTLKSALTANNLNILNLDRIIELSLEITPLLDLSSKSAFTTQNLNVLNLYSEIELGFILYPILTSPSSIIFTAQNLNILNLASSLEFAFEIIPLLNLATVLNHVPQNINLLDLGLGLSIEAHLILKPNAIGTYQQMALVDSTHYGATSDQNDLTYVVGFDNSLWETENLQNTNQLGTINSVTVYMRAIATNAGAKKYAKTLLRTHSADYIGAATEISKTTFTNYSTLYALNPYTSLAWTWAEVNALECGALTLIGIGADQEIDFSEFWIAVDYTLT